MTVTAEEIERLAADSGRLTDGLFSLSGDQFGTQFSLTEFNGLPSPQPSGPVLGDILPSTSPGPPGGAQIPDFGANIGDIVRLTDQALLPGALGSQQVGRSPNADLFAQFDTSGTGLFEVVGEPDRFQRNPDGSIVQNLRIGSGGARLVPAFDQVTDLASFIKITGLSPFGAQLQGEEGGRINDRRIARETSNPRQSVTEQDGGGAGTTSRGRFRKRPTITLGGVGRQGLTDLLG